MRWFRMYNETALDPKFRYIAAQTGVSPVIVIGAWTAMLCHASAQPPAERGTLKGWDARIMAFDLGIEPAVLMRIQAAMEGLLLDRDKVLAWDRRQFESDTSRERTKAWRDRKKTVTNSECDVTPEIGDVSNRHETACDMPEERRVEEKRREVGDKSPTRVPAREEQPLLPDWLPPEAWAEWCEYRRKLKAKGWTQMAARKSLASLSQLRDDGHDPREVIDQSIAAGWTGLFAVKQSRPNGQASSKLGWLHDDPMFDRSKP